MLNPSNELTYLKVAQKMCRQSYSKGRWSLWWFAQSLSPWFFAKNDTFACHAKYIEMINGGSFKVYTSLLISNIFLNIFQFYHVVRNWLRISLLWTTPLKIFLVRFKGANSLAHNKQSKKLHAIDLGGYISIMQLCLLWCALSQPKNSCKDHDTHKLFFQWFVQLLKNFLSNFRNNSSLEVAPRTAEVKTGITSSIFF